MNRYIYCFHDQRLRSISKKTPGFIKNNTRLPSGLHLASKTEPNMGRIAIFLYLFIKEQAKPQGHAQK